MVPGWQEHFVLHFEWGGPARILKVDVRMTKFVVALAFDKCRSFVLHTGTSLQPLNRQILDRFTCFLMTFDDLVLHL